jgi:pimeloyl-ACP methyl ester carboxylesterase
MVVLADAVLSRDVRIPPYGLAGTLNVPRDAFALIVFVHGSGSSRFSSRNVAVARALNQAAMATLLFDLLHPREEQEHHRAKVFDIPLLAERLMQTIAWVDRDPALSKLPLGLYGASTGAAAALAATAELGTRVGAVVSRGGRPDMAGAALRRVKAPTLLIVGGEDTDVLELNQRAYEHLPYPKLLEIVPHATHLFPEPGAMERVTTLASSWFEHHLKRSAL